MQDRDCDYIKSAIEEARRSSPEDERVHPKVGVLVVKDGKVLATAYRGEASPGDHAEFVALEKKLPNVSISRATIYTTLEPCTTRNHPKVPCAQRLVERKVDLVVIGMLDPDPRISGKGVQLLREANIEIELFPGDLASIVEELNRDFIRSQRKRGDWLQFEGNKEVLQRKLKTVLLRAVPEIARITGVPVQDIGMHLWLISNVPGTTEPILCRVARVRLSDATPSRRRNWARGEGVVGQCWEKQTDISLDLTYPRYQNCSEAEWNQQPMDFRMRLTYGEFCETTRHFKAIFASPIVSEEDFIGCVSLNFDRESRVPFSALWTDEVKRILRRAAADAELILQ